MSLKFANNYAVACVLVERLRLEPAIRYLPCLLSEHVRGNTDCLKHQRDQMKVPDEQLIPSSMCMACAARWHLQMASVAIDMALDRVLTTMRPQRHR